MRYCVGKYSHKLQFLLLVGLGLFLMPLASGSGMAHMCCVASALPLVPVADFIDHDAFPGALSLGMLPNKMLLPAFGSRILLPSGITWGSLQTTDTWLSC